MRPKFVTYWKITAIPPILSRALLYANHGNLARLSHLQPITRSTMVFTH